MAKAKSTASAEQPRISADMAMKLDELSIGISIVRGTAKCVQLALWNHPGPDDRDLAILVREHIVKELRRLHKQMKAIMVALGVRPPIPDEDDPME